MKKGRRWRRKKRKKKPTNFAHFFKAVSLYTLFLSSCTP